MKRIIISILYLLIFQPISKAQFKNLTVGDKVPNLIFNNLINFSRDKVHLSEFKGKIVILDFWERGCSACVAAFPGMESLQKEFKDNIQIITVTSNGSAKQVKDYLGGLNTTKNVRLPIVINDDKLSKIFPFQIISHVVWIGPDGIVKAITGTEHITRSNIQALLQNGKVDWPIKEDIIDFNRNAPILKAANRNVNVSGFQYYSSFSGMMKGIDIGPSKSVDSLNSTLTFNFFNQPLLDYCINSLTGEMLEHRGHNQIVLEVSDPNRYSYFDKSWVSKENENSAYCYSITLPLKSTKEQIQNTIKLDLSKWLEIALGIQVKKEKRKVKCLALSRVVVPANELYKPKADEMGYAQSDVLVDINSINFINCSVSYFVKNLNYQSDLNFPFMTDETNNVFDFIKLNLKIQKKYNLSDLKQALKVYGIDVNEVNREREMYVISESKFAK